MLNEDLKELPKEEKEEKIENENNREIANKDDDKTKTSPSIPSDYVPQEKVNSIEKKWRTKYNDLKEKLIELENNKKNEEDEQKTIEREIQELKNEMLKKDFIEKAQKSLSEEQIRQILKITKDYTTLKDFDFEVFSTKTKPAPSSLGLNKGDEQLKSSSELKEDDLFKKVREKWNKRR